MEEMSKGKKIITIIFSILFFVFFVGFIIYICVTEDTISGRWEIYSVRYQGDKFSLNELKIIDNEIYNNIIDSYFVLKENGNAIINFGEEKLVKWEKIDDGIKLDGKDLELKNNYIIIKYDDNYDLYFSRVSRNQSFAPQDNDNLDDTLDDTSDVSVESTIDVENDNIVVSAEKLKDSSLVFYIKSNDSDILDIEIDVEFYDKNGKLIEDNDEEVYAVPTNQSIAVRVDTPNNFASYKATVQTESNTNMYLKAYNDKVQVSSTKSDYEVIVQVKNDSDVKLDTVTVSVVYFKNGKPIGIEDDSIYDLNPGKSTSINVEFPYSYTEFKYLDFDDVKVFVNEAYAYVD